MVNREAGMKIWVQIFGGLRHENLLAH